MGSFLLRSELLYGLRRLLGTGRGVKVRRWARSVGMHALEAEDFTLWALGLRSEASVCYGASEPRRRALGWMRLWRLCMNV